jgi:hypothetical protein
MKKTLLFSVRSKVGLFPRANPVFPQQGEAEYDARKLVTVSGTILGVKFENPRVRIIFEVTDDAGTAEKWFDELASPSWA